MAALRVASWPGFEAMHNAFVPIFLHALEQAGCTIQSLERATDLVGALKADPPPDIVLLHWAERVFGETANRWQSLSSIRSLLSALSRRSDTTRVVWLVHNLAPHDARPLQRLVWPHYVRGLARRIDGFLTLSPGTVDPVRSALPALAELPAAGLWHPAYPHAALPPAAREQARAVYGWGAQDRVLGYCGQIRPYKGVEDLVTAFEATDRTDLRLLLAGRTGATGLAETLTRAAARDPRITLDFRTLPPEAFRAALGACDVIAAPLRRYLHSGSLVHALSAARPVLTPSTPFADSLRAALGPTWVNTYDGPLTPGQLQTVPETLPQGQPDLAAFAPEAVGRQAVTFFESLQR